MLSRLPGLNPPSQVGVGLIGRLGRRQTGVRERKRETQQQSCLRKGVFIDIINLKTCDEIILEHLRGP